MYGKHTLSIQLYSFSSRFPPFLMAIYPHSDGQPPIFDGQSPIHSIRPRSDSMNAHHISC